MRYSEGEYSVVLGTCEKKIISDDLMEVGALKNKEKQTRVVPIGNSKNSFEDIEVNTNFEKEAKCLSVFRDEKTGDRSLNSEDTVKSDDSNVHLIQNDAESNHTQFRSHKHIKNDNNNKNNNSNIKNCKSTSTTASSLSNSSLPHPHNKWSIPSRYQVRHLIGTGSYGHVCEAYDSKENRLVAIKKIHRVFEDLVDCKRILREIAILNRLNHDHIVKILEICVPEDKEHFDEIYLVLEIADSDFKKLFRTPVYLTELHIKTLLYNLLVGLKYIHSAGIYHRDLKPANCLVNQDCGVKICDFGLARTVKPIVESNLNKKKSVKMATRESDDYGQERERFLKRQLTGHVVTRWYRAPELILLQENYTEAIDMWSVGCIFAELLNMLKENVAYYSDRSPLFPGSSCFPLSPDNKQNGEDYRFKIRGNRDQLNMIFNVLGSPQEEDIEMLEKEDAKRYIRIFNRRSGIDLQTRFPGASNLAIDLLKKMLVFNPYRRITVDEALSHPLFKNIRNEKLEVISDEKVTLPFDDWGSMSEKELRYCFLKEIQRYYSDLVIPDSIKMGLE
ncbi:mitogen-activated protein kinase 2 [Cryptosporidium ryanae]|uniref:mitogen-activated protein kinase 2 n=1 Tax=Cryptosporidium ryanae TaxID=515981 RepID=UPI00351AA41D|nr:mitogen-activated protein kinase 2 [Cryptosporidium ryanae]